MNSYVKYPSFKKLLLPFCLLSCSIALYIPANAQEQPPKPIEVALTGFKVEKVQDLSFGTFILAEHSGTVTVESSGLRNASNTNFLPAALSSLISPSPAIFYVTALPGTLITIQGSNNTLNCPGLGGGSVDLTMADSNPISPFVVPSPNTPGGKYTEVVVKIGGTLTINALTTEGVYTGPFTVTFIQQ